MLVTSLALLALAQAPSPDPMLILAATGRTYRDLKSYHFATITVIKRPDGKTDTLSHVMAGVRPSKYREELNLPYGSMISISDGSTKWVFFPEARQYVAAAIGSSEAEGSLFGVVTNDSFLDAYAVLAEHLVKAAKWLRSDKITFDGVAVVCDVIHVDKEVGVPLHADPEADRQWRDEWIGRPTTYWIDRNRRRILKETSTSAKGAEMTTTFTIAKVNERLPATLFRFIPPKGATRVEPSDVPR